jgi:NAD(P)-dependent dehydrogenase (short-subunit alcohol dehydrogenase family)
MMSGKVVLITGAGSGIGRASALEFARQGAHVVVADIDLTAAEETRRLIGELGQEAMAVRVDVSDSVQVEKLVGCTLETFGRLDCAHNNAGMDGPLRPLADIAEEDFDRVLAVNLKGIWLCMRHELPQMVRQGGGAIVNTSSVAGIRGCPGAADYSAAKHGIIGLSRTAALEYAGAGIRINTLCPGLTETPLVQRLSRQKPEVFQDLRTRIPLGRAADPAEVGRVAVWLCSDGASYISGQEIVVDGALSAQ